MSQCFHQSKFVKTLMEAQVLSYKNNGQYYEYEQLLYSGETEIGYMVNWDWR